jgi:CRISPR-associated protein Csn2
MDILENNVYEIVIEHRGVFTKVVESLIDQSYGKEGDFVLSDKNSVLKIDKCSDIIIDYFSLAPNNKRVLGKLYSQLEVVAEDYIEQKSDINSRIVSLLEDMTTSMGFADINYKLDFKWADIFKIYGVEFSPEVSDIVEKMISYIKIVSMFTDIKLLFLVNVRSYLNEEDLERLYEISDYCKVSLVLIESYENVERGKEIRFIIDKDQCLIDAN